MQGEKISSRSSRESGSGRGDAEKGKEGSGEDKDDRSGSPARRCERARSRVRSGGISPVTSAKDPTSGARDPTTRAKDPTANTKQPTIINPGGREYEGLEYNIIKGWILRSEYYAYPRRQ